MLRLADDIVISIGPGVPIRLRASLRAAIRLERIGFSRLASAIVEGNVTLIKAIIVEGAEDDPSDLLDELDFGPLGKTLRSLQEPLLRFLLILSGVDPDESQRPPQATPAITAKPFSLAKHYRRLYGACIVTFHWTPDQVLDATLAELDVALNAHIHALTVAEALSKELPPPAHPDDQDLQQLYHLEPTVDPVTGMDVEFDRAGLHALKAKLGA
ncbi:hypothetical protein SAMN02745157_0209 [Kaistia soli DSM 19436]|uniref:Uncharacterized protein n=1 Tax=Kaistia soli DSM 19436 TaxID=1122133 RepID=A0A1M5PQL2_9HYPH|nr:hypothetical protein [Kaistia soli]SHH03926.1 hypothetical protein SAMN02745157_0209 [Kaistia soli DSM 19436]